MKRIYNLFKTILLILSLMLISNCGRYLKIFNTSFMGGTENCHDISCACPYMCSLAIYDQFQTIALFDILWLSEPVRQLYVSLLAQRINATADHRKRLIDKELKELNDSIAFYVLMPRMCYDTLSIGCNFQPPWSVTLRVNGVCYSPCNTILCADFSPEYQYILGDHFNRYKQPYHVLFSAYGYEGEPIINECTDLIELIISSVKYTTSCAFKRTTNGWCKVC